MKVLFAFFFCQGFISQLGLSDPQEGNYSRVLHLQEYLPMKASVLLFCC